MENDFRQLCAGDCAVSELLCADGGSYKVRLGDGYATLQKGARADFPYGRPRDGQPLYCGLSLEEVLDSGRDLLAERVLSKGEPTFESVRGILPTLDDGFSFLGSEASWGSLTVEHTGKISIQMYSGSNTTFTLFHPAQIDALLGDALPFQRMLDGELPILISTFAAEGRMMELTQFCEPFDCDRDPMLWTRAVVFESKTGHVACERYQINSYARACFQREIVPEKYWDAFMDAVRFWRGRTESYASFALPGDSAGKPLARSVRGMLLGVCQTFSGDHPHYGHMTYGRETHDYFPPTLLTAIEANIKQGDALAARRIAENLLAHGVDSAGRFAYRQRDQELHAASGAEYGQLFWLMEKYERAMSPAGWLEPYVEVLERMGGELASHLLPCAELPGVRLIRMCAEADTSNRVYDYAHNNFWDALGFIALGKLLARYGRDGARFADIGKTLQADARTAFEGGAQATPYGKLPPFQLQYPALPLTLSRCRATAYPVSVSAYQNYINSGSIFERIAGDQDYMENCYANYRYYPEMLSSGLLSCECADAIIKLRESLGGELLCMTRLEARMDDWPVYHYARYLLESGRKSKYLLLLYAHLLYHGRAELGAYYEQVTPTGHVAAPDCVPSALIVPLMLSWMFCFEPVGTGELQLLKGIPSAWFNEDFSAVNIGSGSGRVSISVKAVHGTAIIDVSLEQLRDDTAVLLYADALEASPLPGSSGVTVEGGRLRIKDSNAHVILRKKND